MSAGKGDSLRPVNKKKFDENFEEIFGPKKNWWDKGKKGCCTTCTCKNKTNPKKTKKALDQPKKSPIIKT